MYKYVKSVRVREVVKKKQTGSAISGIAATQTQTHCAFKSVFYFSFSLQQQSLVALFAPFPHEKNVLLGT